MTRRRVQFTYDASQIKEPVIYELGRQFDVVTNIRRANIKDRGGWMILEMQGNEDAVKFLIDHGADLTMKDYRYQSNAEGWARYGSHDERMGDLLAMAAASRSRERL